MKIRQWNTTLFFAIAALCSAVISPAMANGLNLRLESVAPDRAIFSMETEEGYLLYGSGKVTNGYGSIVIDVIATNDSDSSTREGSAGTGDSDSLPTIAPGWGTVEFVANCPHADLIIAQHNTGETTPIFTGTVNYLSCK